jgi:hypothetical protein
LITSARARLATRRRRDFDVRHLGIPPSHSVHETTGIAGCCARAASGHAAAALPSSVMNSRRLMVNMGFLAAQWHP